LHPFVNFTFSCMPFALSHNISSKYAHAHPKVSVMMISYNHEKFIRQAIQSVMMQETNFDYEVVVGEDFSTDNTRQVLLELREKYPNRLKLLLNDRNLGARENTKQTIHTCRGQYMAMLEGDDYWISAHKLQKQVDALDKHPDWSICAHRMSVIFDDDGQPSYHYPTFDPKPVSTLDDLARAAFVGTSSALYRKSSIEHLPAWVFQVDIGDYAISLFAAKHGKIGFIDEIMSAYRRHASGWWSQRDSQTQRIGLAGDLRIIARHMAWQHRRILESQAAQHLLTVVKKLIVGGKVSEARKVMDSLFPWAYCVPGLHWRRLLRMYLILYAPSITQIFRKVKWFVMPAKHDERS